MAEIKNRYVRRLNLGGSRRSSIAWYRENINLLHHRQLSSILAFYHQIPLINLSLTSNMGGGGERGPGQYVLVPIGQALNRHDQTTELLQLC